MATNQTQASPTDKGRAKRIAATSRIFDKVYGIKGLARPGKKAKGTKLK
jgi:hypothetical protein